MLSYSFYAYDNDGISKNLRAGARLLQRYEMEVGVAKKSGRVGLEFGATTKQIC